MGVALQHPNYAAFINASKASGIPEEQIAEISGIRDENEFIQKREEELKQYVEAPVQQLVRKIWEMGGSPYSSNAYGPGPKGVNYTNEAGEEKFLELKPPMATREEFEKRVPVAENPALSQLVNAQDFKGAVQLFKAHQNPFYRRVAELIEPLQNKVKFAKPQNINGGSYTISKDSITIGNNFTGDEQVVIHEMVHALVARSQINPSPKQKKFVNEIKKLRNYTYQQLKKKGKLIDPKTGKTWYAFNINKDPNVLGLEFVTEAMSYPDFQYELMQIPYEKSKTVWSKFVELVADLLGIQNKTALTEAISLIESLAQTPRPKLPPRSVRTDELLQQDKKLSPVRKLALEEQKKAGWNENWPMVPIDMANATFRQSIIKDPGLSQKEKREIFMAAKNLGVISNSQIPKELEQDFDTLYSEPIVERAQQILQKRPPLKLAPEITEEERRRLQETFAPDNKTIIDKVRGLEDRFWQRMAQKFADQFRTIKDYSEKGYMQARLSKAIDGAVEGLLFYGQVFNDGGALNIRPQTKGLIDILKPVGPEVDNFMIWIALNRETNLRAQEKEPSIPDDVLALKNKLSAGMIGNQTRLQVYNDVLREMNALNKSVLTVALNSGLIDQNAFQRFSEDIYYVPFYKAIENEDIEAPMLASGLTGQYFSKQLKGGEKKFGDLVENTLLNWNHILSAAMKNQAAVQTIRACVYRDWETDRKSTRLNSSH